MVVVEEEHRGWGPQPRCPSTTVPLPQDVYIVDPFSGPGFHHLSGHPCTVLGPRALLTSLAASTPAPALPHPVYTAAMHRLTLCFTGVEEEAQAHLAALARLMGGQVAAALHEGVTHLVAAAAGSAKYLAATERGLPVMAPAWVEAAWAAGGRRAATDPALARHSCPPLLGLVVAVTGLAGEDREVVRSTVEEHGGVYSATLDRDATSVLLCASSRSAKAAAARRWGVPCLATAWLTDSAEARACLPYTAYRCNPSPPTQGSTK